MCALLSTRPVSVTVSSCGPGGAAAAAASAAAAAAAATAAVAEALPLPAVMPGPGLGEREELCVLWLCEPMVAACVASVCSNWALSRGRRLQVARVMDRCRGRRVRSLSPRRGMCCL